MQMSIGLVVGSTVYKTCIIGLSQLEPCLLNIFTACFSTGDRFMTATVHYLLHLPQSVLHLGPLWSHSCFPFEVANGDLLKLFHGSQGIEKQVELIFSSLSL